MELHNKFEYFLTAFLVFCGKLFECSGMDVKPYVYLINLQSSASLTSKSQGVDRTGFSNKLKPK